MNYSVREISLVNEIDRIEKDMQQLKAAQYQGFDIAAIKESSTASSYDFLISGAGSLVRYFVFTADKQDAVSGSFIAHVNKGNLSTIATDADFDFTLQDLTHYQSDSRKVVCMSNIYNLLGGDVYFKVYFYGTDTGTLTITDTYPL